MSKEGGPTQRPAPFLAADLHRSLGGVGGGLEDAAAVPPTQPASLPPPLPHIVRFAADPDAVGERDGLRYGTTADLPLAGVDSHSIEVT